MLPNLAAPALAGALEQRDIEVRQTDLNIRLDDDLLRDSELLSSILAALAKEYQDLDARESLGAADCARYWDAMERLGQARLLFGRQAEIARLCEMEAPGLEPLPFGYPAQQDALRLVNVVTSMWGANRMRLGRPTGAPTAEPEGRAAEILRRVFEKHLAGADAEVFGISLLYDSQVACATLLAKCLREWFPGAGIVAGGPYARRLVREGCGDPLSLCLDALVIGEGEQALARLCQEWPLSRCAGSPVVLDAAGSAPEIPIPRFPAEEMPLYWSHPLSLPLQASRGCYWGRCGFCSYRDCYSGPYRVMSAETVARMAADFHRRYGCGQYQFVDDCASPAFLARFSEHLLATGARVKWSACVRFEPQFDEAFLARLAEAGCCRLTFGLETANQQLLDYIRKGTLVSNYLPILRGCQAAKIAVHLNWIAGLPGETQEALEATTRFLEDHAGLYAYQFGHIFTLEPGSPFAESPCDFGLTEAAKSPQFHPPRERERLYAVIESMGAQRGAPERANGSPGPARWRGTVVKEKASFDLGSVRETAAAGTGRLRRLEEPEWAVFDAWNGGWAQFSESALEWLESAMAGAVADREAREVFSILQEQGILDGMESNA